MRTWGTEMEEDETMSTEDMAEQADNKVDALVNLLVKKGLITEEEFEKAFDDLFEDDDEVDKEEE